MDPPVATTTVPRGEEDCSKDYTPVVQLSEITTKTGEEDELIRFKIRCKLFRFSKELKEWKERGTGDVRILEHKQTNKVRLLMRREKTLKICLNHYVSPRVELTENVGSDRSWMWHGVDYADGEADDSVLAIRFRDSESAEKFKDAYDSARDHMSNLKKNAPKKPVNPAPEKPEPTEEHDTKETNTHENNDQQTKEQEEESDKKPSP